jgi:hypothetical protein
MRRARGVRHIIQIALLAILFAFGDCHERDLLQNLREGDYHLVVMGRYDGSAEFIASDKRSAKTVNTYRRFIEKDPRLLASITRRHFVVTEILNFQYMMVLLDKNQNRLVLRYYAPMPHDRLYAGYQLFFEFDLARKHLVKIYSSEVPLE